MSTLTVQQRSCLLRAARDRLKQLHEEYDSALDRTDIISTANVAILDAEIKCVTAAIQWLWLTPVIV